MANKITTKNISKKNQENKINPMSSILIDKVVINIGTGNIEENQSNAKQLLEIITCFLFSRFFISFNVPMFPT